MPNLIRIYNVEFPSEEAGQLRVATLVTHRREKRLFLALSVLISVNVLILSGIATFTALVVRH